MTLQTVVSALAQRLDKPVALNDYGMELLAASAQGSHQDVDEYRVAGILNRRPPAEVLTMLQARGMMERTTPFVVPAESLQGMQARMGVPILVSGTNVAFLWIILGSDNGLNSQEYAMVQETVDEVTSILALAPTPTVRTIMSQTRHIQRLISDDAIAAGFAAAELVSEKGIDPDAEITLSVIDPDEMAHAGSQSEDPADDTSTISELSGLPPLDHRAATALNALDTSDILGVVDGSLVLVTASQSPEVTLRRVANRLEKSASPAPDDALTSGSSTTAEWKTGLGAVYREAAFAARLAGRIPEAPGQAHHAQLGTLTLLRHLPWTTASVAQISPAAHRLISSGGSTSYETVLTYLRSGGDVQETCRILNIHRTTLYYRLDRAREQIGDALSDGWERTNLYIGLLITSIANGK